jgi:4-amino-4-deoxy-L-arabinose transferase-like glycosyltransferase
MENESGGIVGFLPMILVWVPIISILVLVILSRRSPKISKLCKNCGFTGLPYRKTKGSLVLEILCWLLLIVPGIIYSFWRITSRHDACPGCHSSDLIPLDSPLAQKIISKN